jgi:hypothetical protein
MEDEQNPNVEKSGIDSLDNSDYLSCPVWTGPEKDLPTGSRIGIQGVTAVKLVKQVSYINDESNIEDMGIKAWRTAGRPGTVIDVAINEDTYQRLIAVRGLNAVLISQSEGSSALSRKAWYDKYGTDGLRLVALRDIKMEQRAGGTIQPHVIK